MKDRTSTLAQVAHPSDNVATAVHRAKPLPSSEFLAGLAEHLSRPSDASRVFTPDGLRVVLLMSARLTHECAKYNQAASRTWNENRHGNYHTKDARDRAIRDANDLADYAWDEAALDADRAYALLVDPTAPTVTSGDLLDRIRTVAGSDRVLKAVAV